MNLHEMRENYRRGALDQAHVLRDPVDQFGLWLEQAVAAGEPEPNAMTLATVGADGLPAARIVLLKEIREGTFVFYTDYRSRKALDLAHNPAAALVFHWHGLERQVRITGTVRRVPGVWSDAYHAVRPRASQLGAWTSSQSSIVPDRDALERALAGMESRFADRDVPRPDHWGGFMLSPGQVEFWQGRPGRLHDRILFTLTPEHGWSVARLSP